MARVLARRKTRSAIGSFSSTQRRLRSVGPGVTACTVVGTLLRNFSVQGTLNQVRALILLDIIADAHLDIHREAHSTPWLTDIVFSAAQRLGYRRYFLNSPRAIEDDHIPFVELGVSAVDIIDLDYGPFNLYWHTPYDTVDKCRPASLAIVARVVLATLAALETNLASQPRGASS